MNNPTISGYKTYITGAIIIALLILHWSKLLTLPPEVYGSLLALMLMFLRAGVSKSEQANKE